MQICLSMYDLWLPSEDLFFIRRDLFEKTRSCFLLLIQLKFSSKILLFCNLVDFQYAEKEPLFIYFISFLFALTGPNYTKKIAEFQFCAVNLGGKVVYRKRLKNTSIPGGIYLLKVSNRNTTTRCEICSKLTIKTPERRHPVPLLITFNIFHTLFYCFCC